ncbi:cold-shock protein [Yersinia entomophaga]|uniref:Cold-shock protein n=1 Tax=Yersinia entomophaga TaxID=935293 RepID=A0ABN4PQT6_YERET|nr:cold-shock protein [Yersinia entomophaga]ANI28741.1 cold-shock protein [Yersinia entomophaga]OWF89724.1 cold-shock protein [Yersinia entomophaga]
MTLKMGRVKWFNQLKGYGFISPLDGGLDVYVSKMAIANTKNKSLSEGQNVEFSTYKSIHGPSAADVIAF